MGVAPFDRLGVTGTGSGLTGGLELLDPVDFGAAVADRDLDRALERGFGHGAAAAGADHLNEGRRPLHAYEPDVAAVALDAGPHVVERGVHALFEARCGGHVPYGPRAAGRSFREGLALPNENQFREVQATTSDSRPPKVRRTTGSGRPKVQSVDRTLDVLESLASRRGATGISELSQLVGLHVSTVHRLLATLVDRGYVRQDPESSRYHLGSRVFTLASAADLHLDLRLVARPYLERLMRHSGETANLVTSSESEVVYLDQVASMHLVKMFTAPGMRAPLYCTGTGKAMLAFKPDEAVEPVLAAPLRRYTSKTLVTRPALEAELAWIRKHGYSVDNEEMEDGVRCLAVPIFDRRRDCVGAMSVSGPTTRMTPERVEKLSVTARAIADELSRQLGFESEVKL